MINRPSHLRRQELTLARVTARRTRYNNRVKYHLGQRFEIYDERVRTYGSSVGFEPDRPAILEITKPTLYKDTEVHYTIRVGDCSKDMQTKITHFEKIIREQRWTPRTERFY